MDYIQAHKEFLQLIKHENTSTVEPKEFEQYFNYAMYSYMRENYAAGSDNKQMIIDNIQHLRVYTNSIHKWKGNKLHPFDANGEFYIELPMQWKDTYLNSEGNEKELPKYLRLESISAKILYGKDDPCNREGLSLWLPVNNLKAGQRNYIRRSSLRGITNSRIYYYIADNKIFFELYGDSELKLVRLEYYRYPVDIAFNSGSGSQSVTSASYPDYNTNSDIIDPELNDEDVRIILKIAARQYLEGVQSPRIQTFN